MNTKYLIEEQTLKNIADSLRIKEGSSEEIQVGEFAERVSKIEPSTEEYMYITDLLFYQNKIPVLNYTSQEIIKTEQLMTKLFKIEEVI